MDRLQYRLGGPASARPLLRTCIKASVVDGVAARRACCLRTRHFIGEGPVLAAGRSPQAPRPAPEPGAPGAGAAPAFSFTRCWWPVHDLGSIDPSRPHALELLGRKLVLWRDGGGAWRCHEDACPHRLAPLSEGRLSGDGQLECSYHGWRFDGGGNCTRIPQSVDAKAEATARSSPRSCARSYPVKEAAGLIWVWGDALGGAAGEAEAAPLPLPRALQEHVAAGKEVSWYRRELPYSWDVLLENVTDPAHLPYSHHRLTPVMTREKGGPMPFKKQQQQQQQQQQEEGQQQQQEAEGQQEGQQEEQQPPSYALPHAPPLGSFSFPSALSQSGVVAFSPPSSVVYEYAVPGGKMWTLIYGAPSGPGRSIVLTGSVNNRAPATWGDLARAVATLKLKLLPMVALRLYFQSLPRWRGHMISNRLFDMDNVFLHQQVRSRVLGRRTSGQPKERVCCLPVPVMW
ncbi:MAG: hypothetical protein J3K34DRAFT_239010 [Monoraphidium minutum]|nr:MAG: hypothetical protein J3K34DRAFT_239010 [Monoraphidium minutum]